MLRPRDAGAGPSAASRRCLSVGLAVGLAMVATAAGRAQTVGSLGVSAAYLKYEGFLGSGAAVVAPSLRHDSRRFSIAGQGSWAVFESGNEVIQGNAALGVLAAVSDRWRLELAAAAGASKYADEPGSGHLLGGARFHLTGRRAGAWAGATLGRSSGLGSTIPVEATMAGWSVRRRWSFLGSATVAWIGPYRYLDVAGTLRWVGPVEVEARLGARPWSRTTGNLGDPTTGGFGEVTAQVPVGRWLSVSVSGGSYRSDPIRRVLGANYFSAGLRLHTTSRDRSIAAFRDPAPEPNPTSAGGAAGVGRLELDRGVRGATIRILVAGVRAVDLMADFTDWVAVPMVEVRPGVWELAGAVEPGVHRVNVRFNGGAWVVPLGTRAETSDFGTVGVVVVP